MNGPLTAPWHSVAWPLVMTENTLPMVFKSQGLTGEHGVSWKLKLANCWPTRLSGSNLAAPIGSADSKGFFYNRYDEPEEGEAFQSLNKNQKVYYHRLGEDQSEDVLIHKDDDNPEWGFSPTVTEDGKFLLLTVGKGTDDRYRVLYKRLDVEDSKMVTLIDNFEHEYTYVGNEGDVFYFKSSIGESNVNAPKKNIITIDLNNPAPANWKTVIPEAEEAMQSAGMVGDYLIVEYLKDAKTQVKLFDLKGELVREVEFPGIGSANGFSGLRKHDETFYSFSSFNRPPSTYRYDLETGKSTLIREAKVDFNPSDFVVKQVFYQSKDGTKVPMFVCHKNGIELNGQNPTLLYGYGGFNISLTPGFSISRLQWMEMGGVFRVGQSPWRWGIRQSLAQGRHEAAKTKCF